MFHASPPCQLYSTLRYTQPGREYPNLVGVTRRALKELGRPYAIENVPGAPLHRPVGLCGSMFGLGAAGRYLQRHRLFECSFPVPHPPPCRHRGRAIGVYGHRGKSGLPDPLTMEHRGAYQGTDAERREAMGIDWMTGEELAEAIPPAYTRFIAKAMMAALAPTIRC